MTDVTPKNSISKAGEVLPKAEPESQILTTPQAARMLGVSEAFLARDRWAGKHFGQGPLVPFVKVGPRAVRYRREDLQHHISSSRIS